MACRDESHALVSLDQPAYALAHQIAVLGKNDRQAHGQSLPLDRRSEKEVPTHPRMGAFTRRGWVSAPFEIGCGPAGGSERPERRWQPARQRGHSRLKGE